MTHSRFDGIIVGAGHNSLVLQAYMARCGLRVLSLERAPLAGGGLRTIENPRLPGFLHNTHSFFHRASTAMPWYRDLDIESHGARYLEPALNVALILEDGRSLEWWTDPERTASSFARFSRRDGDALRRWVDVFRPIVARILVPEASSVPLPARQRRRLLERSALGRRLLEVQSLTPLEFVAREFENDVVRAGLLFFNGLREVDLRLKGFGHSIPALLAGEHMAQMCIGGSASLARALVKDIEEHGGEVRCGVRIERIVVESGRAVGVELDSGERLLAGEFVASGLNPGQTFLELLGDHCPPGVRRQAERFRYNRIAPLFALNVALEEPPRYEAAHHNPRLDDAFMVILGLERFRQFDEIIAAHERGRLAPHVAWGACPTRFDPTQAPSGKHTAFLWEKVPYELEGDPRNWQGYKETHGNKLLGHWQRFAPNLDGAVLDAFVRTPVDTEADLPNMRFGDLLVGSFEGGQVGAERPFSGAGQYRTPVPGLYLCGASTHPGGNITGLCGYSAARVIAADLGLVCWWNPPSFEDVLNRL